MFAPILVGLIGIVLLVIGGLVWRKDKITLLHDYHYDRVAEENTHAFCAISGWGLILMGIGLVGTAVLLGFTESIWSFLAMAAGFAAGIALLIYAGKKYNYP